MSWGIGEPRYPQIATFWKIVEQKENYATVSLSTSSKDKEKNWHNSNWSYCKFVGTALRGLEELNEKDKIVVKQGKIDRDPWVDKDGKKQYPKNEKITIFAWERYAPGQNDNNDMPPVVEEGDEDIPF
jgi:single-stranded DNA-binding protein